MKNLKPIRTRLQLSQSELGKGLGCTQGCVGHIELGKQPMLPKMAAKLISFAGDRGLVLSYDHLYGDLELPPEAASATGQLAESV